MAARGGGEVPAVRGVTAARCGEPLHAAGRSWMSNFRRLVLGCMDSYDSEQRRIFQHFSQSTRFAFFCTAPISNVADFSQFFSRKFPDFLGFLQNFAEFLRNFSKNQQNFYANLQNFRDWNGAKGCKSCRSRKMQKNASLLAIVAVHLSLIHI